MKLRSKILLIGLSLVTVCSSVYINHVSAENVDKEDELLQSSNEQFYILDEDGNPIYYDYDDTVYTEPKPQYYSVVLSSDDSEETLAEFDDFEDAQEAVDNRKMMGTFSDEEGELQIKANDNIKSGDVLIAQLRGYFEYTETLTGRSGYAHGSSASDAAYITTVNANTIRVKFAGVVADVPSANVVLKKFTGNEPVSYYKVTQNKLYHYYTYNQTSTATQQVGYGLTYLKPDVNYYSYDGHYFYTDYGKMLEDYRNNTYQNSVNPNNPYYNYYQFLSFRTKTNFSADLLNRYITDTKGANVNSKMKNSGEDFIIAQNTYGANAGLMFGIGINESAWGTSNYALNRNNLFGHNAVDSNPDNATYYNSVLDCINTHAYKYISKGYLDGGDSRYRGPHLGDKQSGINVKYASDPYWGEKAASHNYKIADKYGVQDYAKEPIGIMHGEQGFYKEPSTNYRIYTSGAIGSGNAGKIYDFPVTILDTVTDASGNKWYKIYSDTVLNSSRTKKDYAGLFDLSRDYVYVQASVVTVIDYSGNKPSVPSYLKGDVNGDGSVQADDYMEIKLHVLGRKILSGDKLSRADVNLDGNIDASDYMLVKLHVLGRQNLF
ncbi:MAG: glucosaminidase domain-containing protein [Erysipelotrichaceae bacterium]|nr:glucosaminidase domain-containing protein [Erysipelotrichaceae bacterium]